MGGSAAQTGFYYQNNVAALKILENLFFVDKDDGNLITIWHMTNLFNDYFTSLVRYFTYSFYNNEFRFLDLLCAWMPL